MDDLLTSNEFVEIGNYIEKKCGIVLNAQNIHLFESRLASMFKLSHVKNLQELYVKLCIRKDLETFNHVIEAITVNETFWFRDKSLWGMMESFILPEMIAKLQKGETQKIKIWSAACSYGQEPYSLAMYIDHYLKRCGIEDVSLSHFDIIATDISREALKIAKKGQYDSVAISRGLDDVYKKKYFHNSGRTWHVLEPIKIAVDFSPFNLIEDSYHYHYFQYDLVLCRNVLIYFSKNTKYEVYKNIALSLKNEGILLIGSSELIEEDQEKFSRECNENGVYFKKKI